MSLAFQPAVIAAPALATVPRRPGAHEIPATFEPALRAAGAGIEARDRLLGGALCVTTGQQPGLFTGPVFTIYKALSAVALAKALERRLGEPVVPVFWVAGDDHDFAEGNHCHVLGVQGEVERIELRTRASDAPLTPLYREPVGDQVEPLFQQLRAVMPESEFRSAVLEWLSSHYRPDADLATAFAGALAEIAGPFGLVVLQASHPAVKRAMVPWLRQVLERADELNRLLEARANQLSQSGRPVPVSVGDAATPVMLEGHVGRDRLLAQDGGFTTRRGGEAWSRQDLLDLLNGQPERFSPNVLLRPVLEAALLPTLAYTAGPGELAYLPQSDPLYTALGIVPQARLPRWSGRLIEPRVQRVLEKYAISAERLAPGNDGLETDLARDELPEAASEALAALRTGIEREYGRLLGAATSIDPTLKKPVESARNSALVGATDIERRLISHLKRRNEIVNSQLAKARASLFPLGQPQERVLSVISFLARYGDAFMREAFETIDAWVGSLERAEREP